MTNKENFTLISKSAGLTIIILLTVNCISLLVGFIQMEKRNEFNLKFNDGMFWLNGEIVGMNFIELKYWLFYLLLFVISFLYLKRKTSVE
ncbi:hypothetical protein Q4512_05530 [Oceanihabitans sp. 2_MG-2023]|uniref:hypothetical protein n=1 Tax=Oceanihabitans sp. 2_MG-2023 TaxID=3062661 RepID=UPI0026E37534|nr:hypothetical protein [Oceanihabitans sp. 2_MG-2023]MDO6596366.1 hypothetical protein [Oceanihabitans sp. 2_MG-2023]